MDKLSPRFTSVHKKIFGFCFSFVLYVQEKTELECETTLKYQSPLLLYVYFCEHRTCAHLTNKILLENATTVKSQHWKYAQLTHSIILVTVQTAPINAVHAETP